MKYIKSIVITVVVSMIAGWLLFGASLKSVAETAIHRARADVRSNLGDDFKLSQAEVELSKADGDIKAQQKRVAELRVSVQEQHEEIDRLQQAVQGQEQSFQTLDAAWSRTGEGTRAVAVRGQFTEPQVIQAQLANVAAHIKKNRTSLDARSQLMGAREQALQQAEKHLVQIQQRRNRVEVALEMSRVDFECVRLLQDSIGNDVDASSLAAAEKITNEVAHDLRVQREAANLSYEDYSTGADLTLIEQSSDQNIAEVRAMLSKPELNLAANH